MRVLHIGWGFSPWRGGGLIEYAEDLMEIQTKKGFEVYYFCSGRHYPVFKKTKLSKWKMDKINVFEILNPSIYHGGNLGSSQPELDIEEPIIEMLFRDVLDKVKPDIIHIHELAGLPSSLIDIAKDEYGIPVVMTLHNYFLLCPTVELLDANQSFCSFDKVDNKCPVCCQHSPIDNSILVKATISDILNKYNIFHLHLTIIKNFLKRFILLKPPGKQQLVPITSNKAYQIRRNINTIRINKIDLLIAQSSKVEEIYRRFMKNNNIITLHSTVNHLSLIKPKIQDLNCPIEFATLNGFSSTQKGSILLKDTIQLLNQRGLKNYYHFHIWGGLDPLCKNIIDLDNVTYHGLYKRKDLNKNLSLVSVGIVPSIWEEVYGYVGLEFLAKGIPIIGNKKGGIVDYTIENFTGWLNKSSSPEELAGIMEFIIKNPSIIQDLNKKIIENRSSIIKTMDDHFEEIKAVYCSLLNS